MACYKSLLSRFSVLINYTMCSFNLLTASSCFPHFYWRPGFPGSRFFRVQVFLGPVFQGPGFRSSEIMEPQSSKFLKLLTLNWYSLVHSFGSFYDLTVRAWWQTFNKSQFWWRKVKRLSIKSSHFSGWIYEIFLRF